MLWLCFSQAHAIRLGNIPRQYGYGGSNSSALTSLTAADGALTELPIDAVTTQVVYSTQLITVTSCDSTVTNCPASATQITTSMLGPRPKWTFCSGNTALPPQPSAEPQRQPVHADADFAHPDHPFAFVVNVPMIDFNPENGSTEVWLGTHTGELSGLRVQEGLHGDRASGRIMEHLLEKRRDVRGPSQPNIEKGSIVIRDLRLWHTANDCHT